MVEILKEDSSYKYKGFTFDDEGNSITYGYYYVKASNILKKIIKNGGNIIQLLQKYKTNNIHKKDKYINFCELYKPNSSYLTRFTINIPHTGFTLEYEYIIYNKLNKMLGLIQFPIDETFYISKNINHMGYILRPIQINDYKIKNKNIYTLRDLLSNGDKINIDDIINIILQVLCSLSIAYSKLSFTHHRCDIDNLLIYKIEDGNLDKYLVYKLSLGDVYVKTKYIVLFTGMEKAHINIRNFKTKCVKDRIIRHWLNDPDKLMSKSSPNYDLYTFIKSIFNILKSKETSFLSKRVVGHIDKKTIFSILSQNIIKEWDSSVDKKSLIYKDSDDLIQTFHEMGLSSLRLPSNKKVQLYGSGNTGEIIKTRLTYSSIKHNNKNKDDTEDIDIEDCSWSEIRTIAKEFGLKSRGKGINKAFLKRKIREEIPFYKS